MDGQGGTTRARRPYRMTKRAEAVDRTRERITEAAVREHLGAGPSRASIASIAEAAGVTRLTVYRHFADMDEIFSACIGHWMASRPQPDPAPWMAMADFETRARRVLTDLYRWYSETGHELYPVYRDIDSVPASARPFVETWTDPIAAAILGVDPAATASVPAALRAVATHLVRLPTWRSLVVDGGLTAAEAADLAARWLVAAKDRP